MAQNRKGLGRGLAALIPNDEMDLLSSIARGELSLLDESVSAPTLVSKSPKPRVSKKSSTKFADSEVADGDSTPTSQPKARIGTSNPASAEISVSKGADVPSAAATDSQSVDAKQTINALVEWLEPRQIGANPYQPRRSFDPDELNNLTESVREHGILQPIIVRPWPHTSSTSQADSTNHDAGTIKVNAVAATPPFQLIAGERRWRASQAAGLQRVPVIIRQVTDQQALELAVIENVQRHDISPLDAALAYRRLASEFGLSQEKIAHRVGKSRSSVANTQRLLELPDEAQAALQDGTLSEGHGRAILLAPGEGARRAAFRTILRDHLSVRDAEELARRIAREHLEPNSAEYSSASTKKLNEERRLSTNDSQDIKQMTEEIQQKTGCRVQFRARRKGGHFVIYCASESQIEQISQLLKRNV